MDQKFKDEFLKVGITEHLLPVIERLGNPPIFNRADK